MATSRWWATKGIVSICARVANSSPVDEDKIKEEARYDGKWVLTTKHGSADG